MQIIILGNPITKKNSSRIVTKKLKDGRKIPFIMPSEHYVKYEKEAKKYIPRLDTPIDYPIILKCNYYMETRRKCDLVNLLHATSDILVKYGVLLDDNYTIISSYDGSSVEYDKENPRVEINIIPKEKVKW